eukprot:Blabericola_migrator_1__909@NODE_1224_length_5061_cov_46_891470_g818_i1_p5_GENE_NODE_1224_length_5061_cov_46_891470_g818_i1NODE_1224_length_5061_cov_46_891470_g818_i1_p5_ORF_typecomplete_len112_score14_98GP52/PF17468_2/0_25_NODE_1224_length_5061_cov_46_891470_g818_i115811916
MSIPPPPGTTDLTLLLGGVARPPTVVQPTFPVTLPPPTATDPFAGLEEIQLSNPTFEKAASSKKQRKDDGAHKHLRKAAGKVWNDTTLDQWPDNDHRVFCGDLDHSIRREW